MLTPIADHLHVLLSKEPAKDKLKQFRINSIIKPHKDEESQIYGKISNHSSMTSLQC